MGKVKLCELADIYLGVTHTPEYVFDGVPFLSVKDISGGKICFDDCKYISQEEYDSLSEGAKPKVGDMLFCRVGTLGKPIIIPEGTPLFGSFVSLGYLRNKNADRCDLNYLRYWMYSNSFWKQVNSNVKGASQVNLNTGWLSKFDIDLPEMQEQKYRISVLGKCKVIIEQRKEELKVLDNLIKARFVEFFGDPVLNEKGWITKPLLDMGNCKNGMNFHYDDCGVEINCLGVGDFKDLSVIDNTSQLPTVSLNEMPSEEYLLKDDDIVFVRSNGNKALVGRSVAVYPGDVTTTFSGFCIRYRKHDEAVTIPYLLRVLKTDSIRRKMAGRGANIQNLNQQLLGTLIIPVPPIEFQNEFSDFVEQVDKLKVAVQKALDETQLLFDSLMQQYFG